MHDEQLEVLAGALGDRLVANGWRFVCAESCTGGWIAKACTDVEGASAWFDRGFITYTNDAKQQMLDVRAETLAAHGAVSEPVVKEMVLGALFHSMAQLSVAVSGIAGPGGGSREKPVGCVCLAWGRGDEVVRVETVRFSGNRERVRRQAVAHALAIAAELAR